MEKATKPRLVSKSHILGCWKGVWKGRTPFWGPGQVWTKLKNQTKFSGAGKEWNFESQGKKLPFRYRGLESRRLEGWKVGRLEGWRLEAGRSRESWRAGGWKAGGSLQEGWREQGDWREAVRVVRVGPPRLHAVAAQNHADVPGFRRHRCAHGRPHADLLLKLVALVPKSCFRDVQRSPLGKGTASPPVQATGAADPKP